MPDNEAPKPPGAPRRHRGRRGGRGRGRGPRALPPGTAPVSAEPASERLPERAPLLEAVARVAGQFAREPRPGRSAITQAIDELGQIIESLKRVLDQMQDVLELAELAERQKTADEQEIESLRRALRQLQGPRRPRPREEEHRDVARDEPH